MYVFNPDVLGLIPKEENFAITSLFDLLLNKGQIVATHFSTEEWLDVGRPNDLKRANGAI
jgi:NDP-sugar pyrophosphorylase family protein